jgi:PrsW family intramembrane metalloprotease
MRNHPHAFAANPHEHVLQPSVTSTLFPHLPHHRSVAFRLALLAVLGSLLLLGYLRLTGPIIAVAATAVPMLYALYLFEVWEGGREPLYAVGMTGGVGIVLGVGWALLTGHYVSHTILLNSSSQGAPAGRILVSAVLFPLVAQLLMLVGPLILRATRSYGKVLDGFDFGATSALGFVFASTLIYLLPELQAGPYSVSAGTSFALRGVLHGLLVPLIDAGTTGLIIAAVWLRRDGARFPTGYGWMASLPVSLAVAAAVQVGLGLADIRVLTMSAIILTYVGVGAALLLWVRLALHTMLLAEGGEPGTEGAGPVPAAPPVAGRDHPSTEDT